MTSTESAAPLLTREMARNLSVHDSRAWKLLFPAERAAIAAIADGRVVCVPAAQAAVPKGLLAEYQRMSRVAHQIADGSGCCNCRSSANEFDKDLCAPAPSVKPPT